MSSEKPSHTIHAFGPSRRYAFLLPAVSLLFVVPSFFMILISDNPDEVYWGWVAIAIFGSFGSFGILVLVVGLPRLILTQQGLESPTLIKTRRWRWSEVGEFTVSEQTVHHGLWSTTIYCAVAYSDINHDLLHAAGHKRMATWEDADILIPLTGLRGYRKRKGAEDLVATLNAVRECYGRPEVEVDTDDLRGAASALLREKKGRRVRVFILTILGIFLVSVSFAILEFLAPR